MSVKSIFSKLSSQKRKMRRRSWPTDKEALLKWAKCLVPEEIYRYASQIRSFESCHPLVLRMIMALPPILILSLLGFWIGIEFAYFVNLITGFLLYFVVDFILIDSEKRSERWRYLLYLSKCYWFVVVQVILWMLIIILFFGSHASPEEPIFQQVQKWIEIFGILAVFMYPIFRFIYHTIVQGEDNSIFLYILQFLSGMALYSMALWILGEYSDNVKTWVIGNSTQVILGIITIFTVWLILKISTRMTDKYRRIANECATSEWKLATGARNLTKRDIEYTAAHEAGHALVYAALGCLPPGIELVINERQELNGVLGYISNVCSDHHLSEKTFSEWYMLVLLAGKVGESVFYREATLGSSSDYHQWVHVAHGYLSNHFNGIYYSVPRNSFEQQHNAMKLELLQKNQVEQLYALFTLNVEVFHELVDDLLEKRSMGRDELIPFLSRVELPKEFPLPLGDFEIFKDEWPEDSGLYTCNV